MPSTKLKNRSRNKNGLFILQGAVRQTAAPLLAAKTKEPAWRWSAGRLFAFRLRTAPSQGFFQTMDTLVHSTLTLKKYAGFEGSGAMTENTFSTDGSSVGRVDSEAGAIALQVSRSSLPSMR